jgi:hypothetical protein
MFKKHTCLHCGRETTRATNGYGTFCSDDCRQLRQRQLTSARNRKQQEAGRKLRSEWRRFHARSAPQTAPPVG